MRSLIAIAALVASVSAIAGELDGKALTCQSTNKMVASMYGRYGVEFQDGKATHIWVKKDGTKVVLERYDTVAYIAYPTTAKWALESGWVYTLDRKTLILDYRKPRDDSESPGKFECEAYSSIDSMMAELESDRAREQAEIDEEMKGNKI